MPPMVSESPPGGTPSSTYFDALSDLAPSSLERHKYEGNALSGEVVSPSQSSKLKRRLFHRARKSPTPAQQIDSSSDSYGNAPALFEYDSTSSSSQATSLEIDSCKRQGHFGQLEEASSEPSESDEETLDTPKYRALASSIDSRGLDLLSLLAVPRSQYKGYNSPLPVVKESTAIRDLLQQLSDSGANSPLLTHSSNQEDADEYVEFELTDFVIYLPHKQYKGHRSGEMRGLQFLGTKPQHGVYLFDGILSSGPERRYVEGVPFNCCLIGNYGVEHYDVGSNIWIKTDVNANSELYYRLKNPAPEYKRYHDGFLWSANLAKHFVDYCESCEAPVSLSNFRSHFSVWLKKRHWHSDDFQSWYRQLGSDDFRRAVAVNIDFLFKEAEGVGENLRRHPVISELGMEMYSAPKQRIVETETIVTPFVYELFKDFQFKLKVVHASGRTELKQVRQEHRLGLTTNEELAHSLPKPNSIPADSVLPYTLAAPLGARLSPEASIARSKMIESISVGDVLATKVDCVKPNWKNEATRHKEADDTWLFYVQKVRIGKSGRRSFDILWLYRPADTSCGKMKYPFLKELFLSNHCECFDENGHRHSVPEDEVIGVVPVKWNCHPSEAGKSFFIRQTFLDCERFETLHDSHKTCEHLSPAVPAASPYKRYPIGQTVLARPARTISKRQLEVFEVCDYFNDEEEHYVILRLLRRRVDVDGTGKPNELVYTSEKYDCKYDAISTKCLVRFYTEEEARENAIPAPYSRDGTGNAFYITSRLQESDVGLSLITFGGNHPSSLRQGFDPAIPLKTPLRGLDLYCGMGGLGFGMEEGGAVRNEWAVDMKPAAIYTYSANMKHPTNLFYGSVNDVLSQALRGNPKNSKLIPLPEDVDFISAGSPCQGFSVMNNRRNNADGLRNQSMIASVASYIDFYRPKYGLLENVLTMARSGAGREEDILAQLMCAIVAMGYQARIFLLDAWSFGGSQKRSRIFVSFAAPGLEPMDHPALSHSHPPETQIRRLGQLANGQPFSSREHEPTPLEYVSASAATEDLPDIGNGATYQCTRQPEHIMSRSLSEIQRLQISAIPRLPRGLSFAKTWKNRLMTPAQRLLFPTAYNEKGKLRENVSNHSQAWQRVHPEELFSTLVSKVSPKDSRAGRVIHWDQQRLLTIMEGRRIQGMPDNEVLLGTPIEAWDLLGNSVSRQVSLALGLALREAWVKSENSSPPPWATSVSHSTVVQQTAISVKIPERPKIAAINVSSLPTLEPPTPGSSRIRIPTRAVSPARTNATGLHVACPSSLDIGHAAESPKPPPRAIEERYALPDEIPDSDADSDLEIVSETVIRGSHPGTMQHHDSYPRMRSSDSSTARKRSRAATLDHHTTDFHKTKAPRTHKFSSRTPSRARSDDLNESARDITSISKIQGRLALQTSQVISAPPLSTKVVRTEREYDAGAKADFDDDMELMEVSRKARYIQTRPGKVRIVHSKRTVKRMKYSTSTPKPKSTALPSSIPSSSHAGPSTSTPSLPPRRRSSISVVVKTNVVDLISDSEDTRDVSSQVMKPQKIKHSTKPSQPSGKKTHLKPYVSPWPKHAQNMKSISRENGEGASDRLPHDFASIRPPPAKYVPTKNDFLDAYQQTNSAMNRQKYGFGPKSAK